MCPSRIDYPQSRALFPTGAVLLSLSGVNILTYELPLSQMCVCVCFVDCNTGVAPISVTQSLLFYLPERRAVKSEREQKDRTAEKRKTRRDDGEKRKRTGGRREVEESEKKREREREKKGRWCRKRSVTVWWRNKTTCRQTQTQRRKLRLSCRLFVRTTDGNTERKLHPEKINCCWKISTWSL